MAAVAISCLCVWVIHGAQKKRCDVTSGPLMQPFMGAFLFRDLPMGKCTNTPLTSTSIVIQFRNSRIELGFALEYCVLEYWRPVVVVKWIYLRTSMVITPYFVFHDNPQLSRNGTSLNAHTYVQIHVCWLRTGGIPLQAGLCCLRDSTNG